jgi:hypothetical protein
MADVVSTPGEESIRVAFAEAEKEAAFWREHYDPYLAQYPDQFVAIAKADHHVVATSPDLLHLVGVIEGKNLSVRDVWVQFMAATPRHLML